MRNFTLPLIASLFLSLLALNVSAQKTLPPQQTSGNATRSHCGTMEALELWFQQNPAAREQYLRNVEEGKQRAEAAKQSGANEESQRLQAIVTIPVVVHLVLPAAQQALVTKADVIWQINKLNEDFAGVNTDSTNATGFYNIRGRSQIRFCLATQDANGNPTDGINRVYSTITDFSSATVGTIKNSSSCGADSWDVNRYFNIWVAQSASLLGIATFPGTTPNNEQGIALALDGFSNNPAYVSPNFNLGRTAVHEAGHYFGLYHIWGDESGCANDDFRQLPGSFLLPAGLLTGDTPNQAGATGGCPTGVRTDACSAASPGINYQNYMDYTDDRCYSMFTIKQVERAEYVLANNRSSLMTSNGCAPITVFPNDAEVVMMSPGSSCFPGAVGTTFCQGSTFSAIVRLRNTGTTNLTSATLNVQVGTGPVTTQNWTGNLAPFESVFVTINGISTGTTGGVQVFRAYSTNPNGGADGRPSNDQATINLTINAGGGAASVTEGFTSTTFPPTGWQVINPTGTYTWERNAAGATAANGSARVNHYSYSTTSPVQLDYLVAPALDITDADSIIVEFSRAYKLYSATSTDTLRIQVATQCGSTTFPILGWAKGGVQLATIAATGGGSWVPAGPGEWLRERVDLRSLIPAGATTAQIAFVTRNAYGQNVYVDDINLRTVVSVRRDAQLSAITNPLSKQCAATFTPSVRLTNMGKDPLTSVRIDYQILGSSFTLNDFVNWTGNLAQGQSVIVNLKSVTLPDAGNFTIQATTSNPNGGTDQNPGNDASAVTPFRFVRTVPLPLTEGFEGSVFPPVNWARINQDGSGTWFRTTAASRVGAASAVVDNYNYNAAGSIDDLETPLMSYSGIDSAYLSFQVAHASYLYPGSTGLPLDTFQVLVTKDCGQTFTMVYNKWGEDLQSVNDPNNPYSDLFIPNSPSQWKKETINLTQVLGTSGSAQIIFRSKGNFGNTLLLDDVNVTTKTLPARLKTNGYMIAPNPFSGSFAIQHYIRPTNLRGVVVSNSAGQVVYSRSFNGNADSYLTIDLSRYAAGMYSVKMVYDNKVVTERVVKRN